MKINTKVEVKFKKLTPTAKTPTKAYPTDACFDLYIDEPNIPSYCLYPKASFVFHTGIATEIPEGYYAAVYARSGLGVNKNVRLSNDVGIIDSHYRDEWMIGLYNDSTEPRFINNGDRVAQFSILPVPDVELIEVEELTDTDRGTNGFGSSGK